MARRLTEQQRAFTLRVFEAKEEPGPIYLSIYAVKSMPVASASASRLLRTVKVQDLLQDLRQKAEDESVADVLERKQVLTEIVRGRFADFMTNLTPEKLRSAALQEIRIVEYGIAVPKKATTIKLNDPAKAIDLLNKMDKLYGDGANVNIDARTLTINVGSEEERLLAERLINGETVG